jgi:hypothetical protein
LKDVRLRENKKLMEGKELVDVYRAQGAVGIIDLLLTLESDLRTYERNVAEKRCQAIKETPNGELVGQAS